MAGFDAPYVPGWDCHGLPIELNVERERAGAGKDRSPGEFRRACRAFADEVRRLAARGLQAPRRPRRLGQSLSDDDAGLSRRRSCGRSASSSRAASSTRARSPSTGACAIARRSPKPKSSTSRTRRRRSTSSSRCRRTTHGTLAARVPALAGRDVTVLIWTTTPWTIPANLAIAFHPDFDYGAYEFDGRVVIVADALAETVATATGAPSRREGRVVQGRGARARAVPASALRARLARRARATTSRSSRARASCTRRPATARTTSAPACGTASTSTRRSATTAGSCPTSASSAA